MNKIDFVSELSKLRTSATFLSLTGYRNEHGEVADYSIVFHISYENALKRSIMALECVVPEDDMQTLAKQQLLDGYNKSLSNIATTPVEEVENAYTRFLDSNGKYVKGVRLHTETNTLYIYGMLNSKRVTAAGIYPARNKRPLTIAKDKLRRLCSVDKFRQFKITPSQVQKISVENISLLPPTA